LPRVHAFIGEKFLFTAQQMLPTLAQQLLVDDERRVGIIRRIMRHTVGIHANRLPHKVPELLGVVQFFTRLGLKNLAAKKMLWLEGYPLCSFILIYRSLVNKLN